MASTIKAHGTIGKVLNYSKLLYSSFSVEWKNKDTYHSWCLALSPMLANGQSLKNINIILTFIITYQLSITTVTLCLYALSDMISCLKWLIVSLHSSESYICFHNHLLRKSVQIVNSFNACFLQILFIFISRFSNSKCFQMFLSLHFLKVIILEGYTHLWIITQTTSWKPLLDLPPKYTMKFFKYLQHRKIIFAFIHSTNIYLMLTMSWIDSKVNW